MKIKIFFYKNSSFLIDPYLFFPILNVFIKVHFQQTLLFQWNYLLRKLNKKKKKNSIKNK